MNKDELARMIAPSLKAAGFLKTARTWHRESADLFEVFNIQGSPWSKDDFYLNLGIFLKSGSSSHRFPPINVCPIHSRLPLETAGHDEIVKSALDWFSKHNTVPALKLLNTAGRLPAGTFKSALDGLLIYGVLMPNLRMHRSGGPAVFDPPCHLPPPGDAGR